MRTHLLLYMLSTTVALALNSSSVTDKHALLSMKEKLINGIPDALPSWNESLHFCEWEGVTCGRRHMRVSVLQLENQNWGGTLQPALGNLTFLRILKLSNINLHGEIPKEVGLLKRLQILDLSKNNFHGNQISGRIPERIGQLMGLTGLNMKKNFFEGTIPDSIGMLRNLVILVLQENKLSGKIPIVIGNLTKLSEFYLHTNKLEGNIPLTLRYCTKLQSFGVSDNNLSGHIPDQTFGYLEGLINLDLSNNSLTGPIPTDLGNLKHLSILYLYANKLSGEIPNELATCFTLIELMLQRNFFHGSIPSFLGSSLRSLQILDLSSNNFMSVIPRVLENLTTLDSLNLSFNNLYGEVPIRGVFSNVTTLSLMGNKNLCGGKPQLKLPTCFRVPFKKIIFIGVICEGFISFMAFMFIYNLKRNSVKLPSSPSLNNGLMRGTYGELHEATNGFSSLNLVGTGSFGSVYKGSLPYLESPIAVKVLNLETRGAAKSFIAECKSLGKMKHRNLVKIRTCCSSVDYKGEDFKSIVFEYMSNGSLENLLHGNEEHESGNLNLNFTQRLDIALDVAHALDYLHNDTEQVVVHCDVKPSNVLLDDDMVAHLGDFGLARLIQGATEHSIKDQVNSSTIKGTIGYIPPEYGSGGMVSPQGDVYSYGILLLEMLTGNRPTDNMFCENLSLHKFCKMKIQEGILDIVDSCLLMSFADDQTHVVENNIKECLVMFAKIGVACSEEFPTHRMLTKDVIVKLLEIKQKLLC